MTEKPTLGISADIAEQREYDKLLRVEKKRRKEIEKKVRSEIKRIASIPVVQLSRKTVFMPIKSKSVKKMVLVKIFELFLEDLYDVAKEEIKEMGESFQKIKKEAIANNRTIEQQFRWQEREIYQAEKIDSGEWSRLHPDRQKELLDIRYGKIE